jgi:protein-disulfide isomerase
MLAASHEKEFWYYHDLIIKQSEHLDSVKVFEIAEKSLSNFEGFKEKFIAENYDVLLKENISVAEEYKVSGTPTVYINGREFQQWTNINLLKMIVSSNTNNKH